MKAEGGDALAAPFTPARPERSEGDALLKRGTKIKKT